MLCGYPNCNQEATEHVILERVTMKTDREYDHVLIPTSPYKSGDAFYNVLYLCMNHAKLVTEID